MDWARPQYSRTEVDRAGRILAQREHGDLDQALMVIGNWRGSHSFPLNTLKMGLRNRACQLEGGAIVAQRIKRLSSIAFKLERHPTMHLSQMQDIGGCRAILADVDHVMHVRDLTINSWMKHRLAKENDYIQSPKASGYRGIHLVYRYVSDKNATYNGLLIELQVRSQLQHAWATAVETVGTFLEQSLKASQGSAEWLRFFQLMSSAIARREDCPLVPGTPTASNELLHELRQAAASLGVESKLVAYHATIPLLEMPEVRGAKYFLLELRPADGSIEVRSFKADELEGATAMYLEVERSLHGPGAEAVLVSVDSIEALRRAYPNYFLDTRIFVDAMNEAIKS